MSQYLEFRLVGEPRRALYADDDHTAVEIAVGVARDMALHGYMSQSAEIIAPIWNVSSSGIGSVSHNFVRDAISSAGLEMLWKNAEYVPQSMDHWRSLLDELDYTDEQLEMEQRDYFCASSAPLDRRSDCQEGDDSDRAPESQWVAIQKALAVQKDPHTNARALPTRETELQMLDLLLSYINRPMTSTSPGSADFRPHSLALDLALKYNKLEQRRNALSIIGSRIADLYSNAARELALAPRIGRIVCSDGTIQQATGLTIDKARVIASQFASFLHTRLHSGEPRPYSKLSWASLLYKIEQKEAALQEEDHDSVLPFLRPPATPESIKLVETQLGVSLPQDYKDFLSVSDGLGSYNLSQTTPLLPVDEIFWEVDLPDLRVTYRRFESCDSKITLLPPLKRVLQVSEMDEDAAASWWFIEASLIQAAKVQMGEGDKADWLGVNYAGWNPVFSNRGTFRLMMERRLSFLMDFGATAV